MDRTEEGTAARKARGSEPPPGEAIADLLTVTEDPLWTLREEDYRPALEHDVESRFEISNGFPGGPFGP